jgi:hypothetical protein
MIGTTNRRTTARPRLVRLAVATALATSGLSACNFPADPDGSGRPFEVWLIDQSDTRGKTFGGTLYIYDSTDLAADDSSVVQPREQIDLSGEVAALCNASTGANPVRPHMLLFNRKQTHAVLSFVASGHVAILDTQTRRP